MQTTQFFTSNSQLGLNPSHRIALRSEGLEEIEDFADFKEKEIKMAIRNVRTGIHPVPGLTLVSAVIAVPAVPIVPEIRDAAGDITQDALDAIP